MFEKIKKRDERIVKFDQRKITDAILKAGQETKEFGLHTSRKLSNKVIKKAKEIIKDEIPTVEKIQDLVETVLIESGYIKTAKAYIIYRDQHAKIRDVKSAVSLKLVDEYIENEDWRVNENSNMTYSLQGLNNHIASVISAHYWLYKIYPKDVRKAHICGDFHIHDLSIIAPYCISSMQRVITCNGAKLAKDVRIGDELMGFDSIEFKPTKVIEIFKREVDEILEIRAKAGKVIKKIKVTCEHPFLTKEGWIEAGDLKKGDIIITATGKDMKAFYHNYGRLKNKKDLWNMKRAREVLYERMKNKEFRENLDEIGRRNLKKAKEVYKELWRDKEWKKWIIDRRRKSGLYKKASQRMIFNNPMKDKETAKRVAINRKRNNTGFFETNNPMNDPVKKREIMKKAGSRRLPSGLEKRILKIIKKHNLPINYVGNGDIWIGKYNPDFIDETGEKLIEVFRSSMFGTSRIPEMEKKKRHYKKYNKKCLLLNADNYSSDIEIAKEIREFISNGAEIIDIKKIRAKRFRGRQYKYKVINFHCEPFNNFVVERMITHNCVGWSLKDLLIRGFGGVPGKIESKPAKHFRAALGQIVNFFYTLQGETAGAEAFSSVDTYLAPFIRYDKLSYRETKQAIQEFLFNINIPTRVGFQSLVWDEQVVIRENGKIKIKKIGELVDSQFEKKSHRVLEDNPGSFAVENDNDFKVLSFNQKGEAVWVKVKAFIRHKVPKGSKFVKVRTSKGTASVSPAHSLFRFEKLNGEFNVKPFSAKEVRDEHFNSKLKPVNHFIAIKSVKNEGNKKKLDLLEILQEFPYLWQKVYVNVHEGTIDKLKEKVKEYYGGITPFYIQFNLHDRGVLSDWKSKKIVRLDIFLRFLEENNALGFYLRNSKIKTSRFLQGQDLLNFIKTCGWYIAEGHAEISNSFLISQSEPGEIKRILKSLGILGRIEKSKGYSLKGTKTKPVYKISGNGILAALVIAICGTYSTQKEVPWFVYQLEPKLQKAFLKSILSGDGSEYEKYWDLSTTSKKLSAGLSLLLSMNGYKFSVYEEEGRKEEWSDQYTLRIFKDKKRKEAYSVGDFTARICSRLEKFKYDKEFEYDLSVDLPQENFAGGAGLLLFHNTPFTNVTMDLVPPSIIANEHVIIGGKMQKVQYGEFQKEIDLFNKVFAEVMSEGDAKGRVFTFPIPTYNITEDFDWNNPVLEPIWNMTSKYGTPYFANFINSDMKPEDATSMCCRLRIDQRELRKRGGGFFAANPLTGSIGVATINMPRIGYFSKDEKEFFDRLKEKMDLAKKSLEIKRKVLERFTENNLYPYAKYYLNSIKKRFRGYWRNHFSTIGLIGMNEACLNFLGKDIATQEGRDFSIRVLDLMREKLMDYQNETDNIYNLEATPAEGATFRLAKTDKEKFPEIICANEEAFKNGTAPYYTNSTQLPVGYTDDIFEALDLQDELQTKYTGGTVFHGFIGEKLPDGESSKILAKKIAENYRLPYFTITPTFSICPQDGYLSGEHETCPECGAITEVYSRVVGYIRPVKQWNKGKRSEFKDRKTFLIDKK